MSSVASNFISRLSSDLRSPVGKLVLVAAATSIVTSLTVLSVQDIQRRTKRSHLRDEVEDVLHHDEEIGEEEEMVDWTRQTGSFFGSKKGKGKEKGSVKPKGKKKKTSEVIIREALARNYVFFGDEGMAKIRDSFVIVVGLGGVGSSTAAMLVRSGVKKIRLIDFDQVSLSSLNRHATANLAQVGTPKVLSCADYFESVAPWVEVDARVELFGQENAAELLDGKPDYVIDCIDNIDTKVDLLAYCHQNKIPVFSSLGAGAKSDASMIQISDISTTFEDPLARSVRRRLKLKGVLSGVPVVYSTEKPRSDIGLLPLDEDEFQKGKVDELSALSNFRVRILPVLGPLPAMFGNAAAAYVLQMIAGFPVEPLPVKNRLKAGTSILRQLTASEERLGRSPKVNLTEEDAMYLFEEIFRARAVAPPYKVATKPVMLRWQKNGEATWDNLVLFERDEGLRHEENCLKGDEDPEIYWGPEVTQLVNKRFEEEKRVRKYRL